MRTVKQEEILRQRNYALFYGLIVFGISLWVSIYDINWFGIYERKKAGKRRRKKK
jgi:hypothetical protein